MKVLVCCVVSLLFGSTIGWYVGHNHAKHETTEVVEQMLNSIESSEAAEVARAVRAISLIESRETPKAVQSLCTPVANYYLNYGTDIGKNDRRSKLCVLIEELIRTNKIVADAITNRIELAVPKGVGPQY